ncbi:MAG: outer membrane protein transport protein [Myxococcales bacterium]|nr:outer membrane protein transport protein [Myxococcales bacterium]
MRLQVASLLLAAAPTTALAGGFESEYPDNNARVLGRAGAFVARADDPSAIQYNPAGLARLHGLNLLLSVNLVNVSQAFTPDDDVRARRVRSFGEAEQSVDLIAAPMLALHFDLEALPAFDFAVGIYGPSGTTHRKFPGQWTIEGVTDSRGQDARDDLRGVQSSALAQNGLLAEAEMIQAYPTVAVAWTPLDELRIGVSLQASFLDAKISKSIGGPAPGVVTLDVADPFTPTAILGVLYQPTPWLELGAMYRPSFENVARGKARLDLYQGPCPQGACPTDGSEVPLGPYGLEGTVPFEQADGTRDDDITFTFTNPDILRVGARFVHPRFDVEVDYIWQRNSVHDGFLIEFDAERALLPGLDEPVPVPTVLDERYYDDTHGVRLGSDVRVLPELLTVRAGASYETGASPDAYTTLDFPGLDQWSLAAGATVHLGAIDIDAGFTYVGLVSRQVDDSKLGIIDILLEPSEWVVVGNGAFSGRYLVGGLGATLHL